jgi:hypothetical protein
MKTTRVQRRLVSVVSVIVLLLQISPLFAEEHHDGHILRVRFHPTSFTSTQADPNGFVFAPGDQISLGGTVLRFESPNDQIGTVGLQCSATGADGSELLCIVSFTLQGGKITGQTLFDVKGEFLNDTRKLAITGGTGVYRNARGEMTVTSLSSGDENVTFNFGD